MYRITDEQIDFILTDLSARGLKNEDLQQNILDHVCCIIEQELEENGDFRQFYLHMIERFYKKQLSEIEEETLLLLTFKNYYTMKKVMIGSGAAAAALLIGGSIFKLFYLPGAAMLLVLGVFIMCFFFLPLLLVLKMKETSSLRDKFIMALGVVIGILYCASAIFKVQHWPGANIMIFSTIILLFFIFIPVYFFTGIRKPETRVNTIVSSIILVAATTMQFTLTSIKFLHKGAGATGQAVTDVHREPAK
ncbi:MAG TPA: hypothetical protein VEB40_03140 [Flavipsychrobacter sp.]|nr:hypothetical protein [Flavipsychrobacter sp.]